MSADQYDQKMVWLLGQGTYQRLYLRFWMMTSGVYTLLMLLQHYSVTVGLIGAEQAQAFLLTVACGLTAFYVALRSGWSRQFADPALTAAQIGFAVLMLAMAYVLMPKLRGAMLMVTPLVLLFGAFTLPPLRCRQLGWFAVIVQGLTMALAVWLQLGEIDPNEALIGFLNSAIVFPMTAAMAGRLSAIRTQLRSQKKDLNAALELNLLLARQDDLTGLPNRRHAFEVLAYEERRSQRRLVPPCICLLDLDHFKRINDTYGHAAGDDVLRLLARHGMSAVRTPDTLARWGGEEFILVMPETPLPDAMQVVERLRSLLAQPQIWEGHLERKVTFSAGIAAHRATESIQETVERADVALSQAKLQGRNRTVQA